MKKWMTCLIVGAVAFSLAGCQQKDASPPPLGERMQLEKVYTNSADQYVLSLPEDWFDVEIVEEGRTTDFIFPSEDPDANALLLRIVGMTEEEWQALQAREDAEAEQYKEIMEHEGSRYVYWAPTDAPLEGKELERFEALARHIPVIIAGMHF